MDTEQMKAAGMHAARVEISVQGLHVATVGLLESSCKL